MAAVAAVDITKAMLQYIRGSSARYKDALQRKRKVAAEETERAAQKTWAKKDIDSLKARYVKLAQETAVECHKIDCEIAELEKQHKNT